MIYISARATILRRPEIVWKYLTDVTSLTSWVEDLIEAEIATKDDPGVGMRIDLARRTKGKRSDATVEVSAWREPSLLALETRIKGTLVLDRASLNEVGGGTELVVSSEISTDGVLAQIFARPVGLLGAMDQPPPAQAIYERSVQAFKKFVETATMTPYR